MRSIVATWNDTTGNGYQDPSVFGVLTLTGKPASPGDNGSGNEGGGGNNGGNEGGNNGGSNGNSGNSGNGSSGGGNSGSGNNSSGGSSPQTGIIVSSNGVVTIKPEAKIQDGRAVSTISSENLNKALEQAAATGSGKKQILIEAAKPTGAGSVEVQLPAQSLSGKESFDLLLQTDTAVIRIPNGMLSNQTDISGQVSIRIGTAPADNLNVSAADRERIGSRPVIELSLAADGKVMKWNNPAAPITVEIPYKPTLDELSHQHQIVVWYVDGQGRVIPVPNGRYDAAHGTVVFQTTHFSSYAVAYVSKTFADLQNVPWAKQAIEAMAARGVIQGTSESRFSPEVPIKRADFAALLVRALELQGTGSPKAAFSDVDPDAHYHTELDIAGELGIAVGLEDHTFRPNSPITRQEMMVFTARALAAAGKTAEGSGSLGAYSDAASIAGYAKDSAAALVKAGIITGSNGKIAPQDPLTRAEAAVILYRAWKLGL